MAMRTRRGGCAPARGCPQVAAPKTPAPGGKAGLLWPRAGGVANGRSRCCLARRRLAVCPRRLRACLGVLVELSAPPTGSASAPRRSKLRGRDHRWRAGGNRCRHPSNGAGRIAAGRDGGCWCSTLVAGCGWPLAAVSALGPKVRSVERSAGWRRRGGGCGTRSRGAGAGISTASRSPRLASRLRSSPRRARSMRATWPTPGRRRRGFTGIAGVGVGEERSRCCAWCVPAGWRGSRTGFLWSRLIAWFRFSGPAREPHRGPGSWLRSLRPAEREALRGLLAAWSRVGRRRPRTRR